MKRAILEIYALAVCFFTVACFMITLGFTLWNVVELAAPEFTLSSEQFACYQSDQQFSGCFPNKTQHSTPDHSQIHLSGDTLASKRAMEYAHILHSEQRDALQGLAKKIIILLINIVVFFSHWILARRARSD